MSKDLIKTFNKVTKKIKQKEDKPVLKVCSYCKKMSDDWIATLRYESGELLLNKVMCGECQNKRYEDEKREETTS